LRTAFPGELPADYQTPLLLANILANPLIELAETLAGLVCAGGQIVLSGVLDEQALAVSMAYAPWFQMQSPQSRECWVRLVGLRTQENCNA